MSMPTLPGSRERVRLIVLDVDDTVYLEQDYIRSGFGAVGLWLQEHRGLAGFASHAWGYFEGGLRGSVFDAVLADLGAPEERGLVQALVEIYRTHRPDISLLPDARLAMDRIGAVARLAVITDGPGASQRNKVEALGLGDVADPVVVTDEHGPAFRKPSPAAFEFVMKECGARPAECTYVADNPVKDFAAPRLLGWQTVRVRRPGGLHELTASGPDVDHEVADLGGLPELLELA